MRNDRLNEILQWGAIVALAITLTASLFRARAVRDSAATYDRVARPTIDYDQMERDSAARATRSADRGSDPSPETRRTR